MKHPSYWRIVRGLAAIGLVMVLPASGYAQEAVVSGTVRDATGGVLPGVTVTAIHEATGNTFEAVTNDTGAYRIPVRTGAYRVTAGLTGFATVTRTGLELLLGQQAVVNFELSVSSVQESVTVTAEAPLLDVTSSTLGGNIDPRQMQELPLNGRNWMDLAMLAPGSRQNQSSGAPLMRQGYSQINIDGQQVTTNFIGLGDDQPRFSRDAIAEFVLITNRFDATQGRSTGMLVNAQSAGEHDIRRTNPPRPDSTSSATTSTSASRRPSPSTARTRPSTSTSRTPACSTRVARKATCSFHRSSACRRASRCTTSRITRAAAAATIRRTPSTKAATPRSS